jgi:hypothetical protein
MNETVEQWIRRLEAEWSKPNGFLGKVREGAFDEGQGSAFATMLEDITPKPGETTIDRRLVALIWYVPVFLRWQKERIAESGGNVVAFERLTNRVQGIVERILGVP